jgi:hypothetical protein
MAVPASVASLVIRERLQRGCGDGGRQAGQDVIAVDYLWKLIDSAGPVLAFA